MDGRLGEAEAPSYGPRRFYIATKSVEPGLAALEKHEIAAAIGLEKSLTLKQTLEDAFDLHGHLVLTIAAHDQYSPV